MPVISRFFGTVIIMYWHDHNPPHFHAKYAGYDAIISIETGQFFGNFPKRAESLVKGWLELHKEELTDNWTRASRG